MSNRDLIERLNFEASMYETMALEPEFTLETATAKSLREAATALEAQEWNQNMDEAPKDGTVIHAGYLREEGWWSDLYDSDEFEFAADDHGFSRSASPLTHWRHITLPEDV